MSTHDIFQTAFGLLGGLAVFIFGMNMMSECLQKAAGEKMKTILGVLTKNPVMGVLAGALVTAVLQSSSATTVMAIGFVSAGLMSLPQAISVILGANIGTTMTAQLMAFKISDYIWMIIFIGFAIFFLSKKEKVKSVGQTIFAFGLLFVGIETMSSVMKPLANSPVFVILMEKVSNVPVLGLLLGTAMTVVVQSSSATIAVLQSFASQPGADGVNSVIGLAGAIPILLGDNIGTTITALLASVGQSKNAKRTAVAHSVFNISGSLVFIWIIPLFARFVQIISPKGNEIDVISRQIANAHFSFNLINTLIWLPLLPIMVKIVTFLVRGDEVQAQEESLKFIDNRVISQPVVALHLARQEVLAVFESLQGLMDQVKICFVKNNTEILKEVDQKARKMDAISQEIAQYMSALFASGGLTEEQSTEAAELLYVVNDIDKICDRCIDLSHISGEKIFNEYHFSEAAIEELERCFIFVSDMLQKTCVSFTNTDKALALEILEDAGKLKNMERKCRKNHVKRIKKNSCKPEMTGVFVAALQDLERIGNSCINIAEEIVEQSREKSQERVTA
ncbi:MAG: Na/Pi cotransporter family protein [Lachnospiraceae bacterium]|nr:Na/Pi cotransporter family protein [Lachnospiraceae bacterium]